MADITRSELKNLRELIVPAVQNVLGDGYLVEAGPGRYGFRAELKLLVTKAGEDGVAKSSMQIDFEQNAVLYGLEPSDFGGRFRANQTWYKIIGLKARNRKYPIIAEHYVSGDRFKFGEDTVITAKQLGDGWWEPADAA
jgi:hypothetical protein